MVVFIIIARMPGIGAAEFGQLTYAVALASIFALLSQFGLIPLMARDIAADPESMALRARPALSLRILLSIACASAMAIYARFTDLSDQGRLLCFLMGAAVFIGTFTSDIQALFQSREKLHLELIGIVAENTLLLLAALSAFFFRPNIVEVGCLFLTSKLIGWVINYLICGKFLIWVYPAFQPKAWKGMVAAATPFALAGIISAGIIQLDTILLRELSPGDSEAAVGVYQAAIKLFMIPMLLPEIILKVFLPQFSRMHGASGSNLVSDLGRVNNVLLTSGMLIGFTFLFRGRDFVQMLYGEGFAEAGQVLQVLGLTILLRFGAAYNLYFTIRDRIWFRVSSAALALASVVVFDILLIPKFGPMGAAYASVLAHLVHWVPYLFAIYLSEKTVSLGWKVRRACGFGILYSALLYLTSCAQLLIALPLYAVLGATLLLFSMPAEDRGRILSQIQLKKA